MILLFRVEYLEIENSNLREENSKEKKENYELKEEICRLKKEEEVVTKISNIEDLFIENSHGFYKIEGRNLIFNCDKSHSRSLILKKGIIDGILEVFGCFLLFLLF
jgi:predicted nuclease with TOPRIM domain